MMPRARRRRTAPGRGPADTPAAAPRAGARGRIALLRAVVGGSLDRAMDVAATLEVRGFAGARRAPRSTRPLVPPRLRLRGLCRVAIVGLAVLGRLAGAASFTAYPLAPHRRSRGPRSPLASRDPRYRALLPFADRRGIEPVSAPCCRSSRSLPLPRRAETAPERRQPDLEPGGVLCRSRPLRARASRRSCAPPAGSCRTSTAAASPAGSRSAGLDTPRARARRARSASRESSSRIPRPSS